MMKDKTQRAFYELIQRASERDAALLELRLAMAVDYLPGWYEWQDWLRTINN